MRRAPGGKTTFLAEAMKNEGKIIAVDKYRTRLDRVSSSCERLGISIVECVAADGVEYQGSKADKVIVDAPCSGLGILSKKPDIKLKRELRDINELVDIQTQLLENASSLVKDGGAMVYSTCTIEPEENFGIVKQFLAHHPDFSIDHAGQYVNKEIVSADGFVETLPHVHGIDGSFSVRLVKSRS